MIVRDAAEGFMVPFKMFSNPKSIAFELDLAKWNKHTSKRNSKQEKINCWR